MHDSPSRHFCKPILGRLRLSGSDSREDYIDVRRRADGTVIYVLNRWSTPRRPVVVPETDVRSVEPFGRPRC